MKTLAQLVLTAVAAGSCVVATAAPYDSADMERRARNREEAIANHERMVQRGDARGETTRRDTMRHDRRDDASPTVGQRIDHGARKTRDFTHRTLNKMRNFGERQNRKHPAPANGTVETDKAPTAIGK